MIGSLTSGLLGNLEDIAVARVAALTPFVGSIGDIIFMSSQISVRTFESTTRKSEAQFAEHQVIYGKPVSEFTGNSLDDFDFRIVLHGGLGVEPLTEFEKMRDIKNSGQPQNIFLEGKFQGNYTLRGIEGETTHWHLGRPIIMLIDLKLREYVDSIPTNAEMKLREDELRRGETGKGGPEKLPGTADKTPSQPRALKPVIDPVTRMVTGG
jgi:hypothetical protein